MRIGLGILNLDLVTEGEEGGGCVADRIDGLGEICPTAKHSGFGAGLAGCCLGGLFDGGNDGVLEGFGDEGGDALLDHGDIGDDGGGLAEGGDRTFDGSWAKAD